MTAGIRRVTVDAKTTVVSATPVAPGKTYPLSALDHALGRHVLRMVFYYRQSTSMDTSRLKDSLSEVLSYYPAITGRLARDEGNGWVVKCNDAGLRLVEALARTTLDEWLATATNVEEMDLAYWEPMGPDPSIWSPYYVQLTEFADKAVAIGLTCPHYHADPTCATLLIRAWADTHRRACITYPPFLHSTALLPRSRPNPCSPLFSSKSTTSAVAHVRSRMTSATFVFPDAAVKLCLAHAGLSPDAPPFDALAALFWICIARASATKPPGPADLTIGFDFRKRMYAPLPHGFYGNAFHFYRARADLAAGLGYVAAELRKQAEAIVEEDFWKAVEWLQEHGQGRREGDEAFQMYGPELTCAEIDGPAFAHGTTFEKDGGLPAHVTWRVEGADGAGLVLVAPAAAEGAARQVTVTLPEEVTGKVCCDDAIMKYSPTVLFAPARG